MKKILLAYDGGEPARRALETAGELARAFHAPLSVVSVVPEGAGRPVGDPREDASAHARELQEAKRLLAEMGLEVELLEPSGDPARRIEQIAEEGGFDTIVLGSGGWQGPAPRGFGADGTLPESKVRTRAASPGTWSRTQARRWSWRAEAAPAQGPGRAAPDPATRRTLPPAARLWCRRHSPGVERAHTLDQ
jgi:nucleotide-binding universal stress UspA family protein